MLLLAAGDFFGYLIPLALFGLGFYAIHRWAPPARRTLFSIILAVVALVWLLSALGVLGTTDPATGNWRPF